MGAWAPVSAGVRPGTCDPGAVNCTLECLFTGYPCGTEVAPRAQLNGCVTVSGTLEHLRIGREGRTLCGARRDCRPRVFRQRLARCERCARRAVKLRESWGYRSAWDEERAA